MSIEAIINFIEVCFSIALFVNAILFVPQIIKLLKIKESKDLSALSFGGFSLIQILAVLHGYINKDYILMMGFLLSLMTCGTVTFLIFYYRFKEKYKSPLSQG